MKFFGKELRLPKMKAVSAEAPEKTAQPSAKGALLQTYFVSLLCMVLCVTMFLGTSFAWFSSEVYNESNEIYIGYLDVGLFKQDGNNRMDLSDNENKLFDRSIRWEPGYTSLETIHVVNEGDLAFKYVLSFTDGILDGDKTNNGLMDVAKWFDVWYYTDKDNTVPASAAYHDITAPDSGWAPAGTLDQLLAGQAVFSGKMEKVRDEKLATAPTDAAIQPNKKTTDGAPTEKTYTIALHMNEAATISAMGHKISLHVKLVAYQMASESDDFGIRYDQMVTTPEELAAALKKGGTVALAGNITLTEGVTVPKDTTTILDLNGHTISMEVGEVADKPATTALNAIVNKGNLAIDDSAGSQGAITFKFKGPANSAAVNAIRNEGMLVINGGKISNTANKAGAQIGYAIDNYPGASVTVNGGKITASGSDYYDGIRLFCNDKTEIAVTVNGGNISSIWAQNPSTDKAAAVKGSIILNGGEVTKTFFENHTTVKVIEGLEANVIPYGAGKENTAATKADGYTVYAFVQTVTP